MNYCDQKIFDFFNATLWAKIAKYPDFQEELEEFQYVGWRMAGWMLCEAIMRLFLPSLCRRLQSVLATVCAPYAHIDESTHRRILEERV